MNRLFCVDLEGTLISNAVSQIPRPVLFSFSEFLGLRGNVVLFTSVSQDRTHAIQEVLVAECVVPSWFSKLDSLHPVQGQTIKDLSVAERDKPGKPEYYLSDDHEGCIKSAERDWWIPVS